MRPDQFFSDHIFDTLPLSIRAVSVALIEGETFYDRRGALLIHIDQPIGHHFSLPLNPGISPKLAR
jgi:hypothetical protein